MTTVKPEKILIAMSGGVDSSVAALLLSEAGCECVGATMRLFHNEDAGVSREKSCCSLEDVEDARSVAYQLGMPFYVFNFTDGFGEQVMDRFVDAYERGATPNPCIDCNRYMKFAKLVERAELLGCDAVATGHYARIEQENGRWLLKKAVDDSKDQSYVLYFLNQHQLAHLRFPLGTLHKTEAREIAEKHGLVNARKRDSQDICFVPDGDYARVIELRTGQKAKPGPFVDREGHVLGEHAGIIHYTIGQRKGLGLGIEHPYYVCEKRPEDNTVVLGPNEALFTTELDAGDFNWIAYDTPPAELHVKAKIRYRQQEQPATVTQNADGTVHVSFDEPQRAIARGQAVVLYDGDTVVGGGTILWGEIRNDDFNKGPLCAARHDRSGGKRAGGICPPEGDRRPRGDLQKISGEYHDRPVEGWTRRCYSRQGWRLPAESPTGGIHLGRNSEPDGGHAGPCFVHGKRSVLLRPHAGLPHETDLDGARQSHSELSGKRNACGVPDTTFELRKL